MTVGVRLENKNMTTEATVKNYGMKIINHQWWRITRIMDRRSKDQS